MPNLMATKFRTPSFSTGITNRYNSRRHFREPFITSTLSRIASWKCLTLCGPPQSYKGSKHYNNPTRFYPKKVVSSTNFGGKCWCWWILMLRPTFLKCFNALLCSSNTMVFQLIAPWVSSAFPGQSSRARADWSALVFPGSNSKLWVAASWARRYNWSGAGKWGKKTGTVVIQAWDGQKYDVFLMFLVSKNWYKCL